MSAVNARVTMPDDTGAQISALKEINYGLKKATGELERENLKLRENLQVLNNVSQEEHKELLKVQKELIKAQDFINLKSIESKGQIKVKAAEMGILQVELDAIKIANITINAENKILNEEKQLVMKLHSLEKTNSIQVLKKQLESALQEVNLLQDRTLMDMEDKIATDVRFNLIKIDNIKENSTMKNELVELQSYFDAQQRSSLDMETQLVTNTVIMKDILDKHASEVSKLQWKISELTEITSLFKLQNRELEEDVSILSKKLTASATVTRNQALEQAEKMEEKMGEITRLQGDMNADRLQLSLLVTQSEDQANQLGELNEKIRVKMEAMKDMQTSHSLTIANLKEKETLLETEIKKQSEQLVTIKKSFSEQEKIAEEKAARSSQLKRAISLSHLELLEAQKELALAQIESQSLLDLKATNNTITAQLVRLQSEIDGLHTTNMTINTEKLLLIEERKEERSKYSLDKLSAIQSLTSCLESSQEEVGIEKERTIMSMEDNRATIIKFDMIKTNNLKEIFIIKNEFIELKLLHNTKVQQSLDLSVKLNSYIAALKDSNDKHEEEKSRIQLQISDMLEITSLYKVQNRELEEDVVVIKNKLNASNIITKNQTLEITEKVTEISNLRGSIVLKDNEMTVIIVKNEEQNIKISVLNEQIKEEREVSHRESEEMQSSHSVEMGSSREREELLVIELMALKIGLSEQKRQAVIDMAGRYYILIYIMYMNMYICTRNCEKYRRLQFIAFALQS